MKKSILFFLLAVIGFNTALSQSQEAKKSVFQFTFFPPVGTQGTDASNYSNDFSFNLLAGVSQNERYFTLGGLANIISNNASGFQLAGISNIIGNNASGFQLAGIGNIIGDNASGFQLAGIGNIIGNNASYFQLAGIANITGNDAKGFQLSGIANIVGNEATGFQLAGLGNIAGDVKGFQLAGIFNKAKNVEGVQLAGLVNIADYSDYPIGLLNIIKNGEMGVGISYNETGSAILSFRSGGRVMYGILGLGYNHRSVSKESFIIEGGLGAHINCTNTFRINTEAKAHYFSMFRDEETSQYILAVLPALKLSPNFEIFAGPTVNYLRCDNLDNEKLFPKDTSINIWKSFDESRLEQIYIGFSVGAQFLF